MPYASPEQRKAVWHRRREADADVVIRNKGTGQTLTKGDVVKYYADPRVQTELLKSLKDRDLVAVISRDPKTQIFKRYEATDRPLHVSDVSDLARYVTRRYSEFHPTVGKSTKEVWVDIDPGKQVSPQTVKHITKSTHDALKDVPEIKDVELSFSGGRGYHVRGLLREQQLTDEMRERLRKQLQPVLDEYTAATLKTPSGKEVRLDVSTLHDKGSIRAPYSLNSETGLVAVPLSLSQLDTFRPRKDATPEAVLKQLRFFAPGIPRERRIQNIPTQKKSKHWTLAVQEHDASRAGRHWDLRLVDPATGHAHSWAVPKARFPERADRPLLALQQPTHTSDYALNFGLHKPEVIGKGYGKGTVEIKHKEPVKVVSSGPDRVKFERVVGGKPKQYVLFKTKDTSWLMRDVTPTEKQGADMSIVKNAYVQGYNDTLEKLGVALGKVEKRPSIQESRVPLESRDQQSPAGLLAQELSQIPEVPRRNIEPKARGGAIDARLNKSVSWESPLDLGATTPPVSPFLGQF